MPTRELESSPNLLLLYAKAAITGVTGGDTLPDEELVRRTVEIDRDALADYDRVCGYRLRTSLPPTYPHILAFPLAVDLMADRDFPFALPGLVHIRNQIVQERPIEVDERLDLRVRTENLRPHTKGRQFDVVAEASVGDEPVWRGVSTYLRKGGGDEGEADEPREIPSTDAEDRSAVWKVPADTGRRYAAVSGDRNPIHLSPVTAKLFGFPRQIAHGMWTKARALAALEGRIPESFRVDVRFKVPLVLPATVGFDSRQTEDGVWAFAVRSVDSGKPHLEGSLTPR